MRSVTQTTKTEVEGNARGHYGSFMRKLRSDQIVVEILTPKFPHGLDLRISADSSHKDLWDFASDIQQHLDGSPGDAVAINEVFLLLQEFTD